jgi:antitoxin HicB
MNMFQYSINLAWSDEDGGYIATVPELPNLSAFGESPEEAVRELQIAAEMYLEVLKEDGHEIPQPRKIEDFSGQIRLRMPRSLHRKLAVEARSEGMSLNTYLLSLLSENYGYQKASKERIKFPPILQLRPLDTGVINFPIKHPHLQIGTSPDEEWHVPERSNA